jgi:chemotaxis protein MotB
MSGEKLGTEKHGGGRHKKPKKHEEGLKVDAPIWMISWADMTTLLMALFVALYSISTLDIVKFEEFLKGIRGEFTKDEGQTALEAMQEGKTHQVLDSPPETPRGENEHLGDTKTKKLVEDIYRETEKVREGPPAAAVLIPFEEGSATLTAAARTRLRAAAVELRGYASMIEIRGHTSTGETDAPRNLAYTRAMKVYDFLTDPQHGGIPDRRLKIVVMGAADPAGPDMTKLEKVRNRRVEVLESPEYPKAAGR